MFASWLERVAGVFLLIECVNAALQAKRYWVTFSRLPVWRGSRYVSRATGNGIHLGEKNRLSIEANTCL